MLYFPDGRPTLPERFVADLSGNIQVRRVCDLKWQRDLMAGVAFCRLRDLRRKRRSDSSEPVESPEPE